MSSQMNLAGLQTASLSLVFLEWNICHIVFITINNTQTCLIKQIWIGRSKAYRDEWSRRLSWLSSLVEVSPNLSKVKPAEDKERLRLRAGPPEASPCELALSNSCSVWLLAWVLILLSAVFSPLPDEDLKKKNFFIDVLSPVKRSC